MIGAEAALASSLLAGGGAAADRFGTSARAKLDARPAVQVRKRLVDETAVAVAIGQGIAAANMYAL